MPDRLLHYDIVQKGHLYQLRRPLPRAFLLIFPPILSSFVVPSLPPLWV